MPEWTPPPLPPPPPDAIRLFIAWQAAIEHTAELKATIPYAGESVVGGIVTPLWDERVVQAMRDEVEAAYQFHSHRWWFGAFNSAQADAAIREAAARLAEGL